MSGTGLEAYVQERAGLGDVPDKLRSQPCTIAYLGASVTLQRDGYRPRLHSALQEATGQEHRSVTAAMSGSGSISGAFMTEDLVLSREPELCFVDFTSRDAAWATTPGWVGAAVEGIVLKLLAGNCQPCFVYTYRDDEGSGVYAEVQAAYEGVTEHYGVPSVDVASQFRDMFESGSASRDELLTDVVHTTPAGAQLAADAIAHGVLGIRASATPVALPPRPLHDEPFADARLLPAADVPLREPAGREERRFRFFYDYVVLPLGNAFEWALDAELVGMLVVLGPETSGVRITSPDGVRELTLRDTDCFYNRLATMIFETPYPPGMRTTIEPLEVEGAHPDPGVPVRLNVVGFLAR
jgi:hypothetical protein